MSRRTLAPLALLLALALGPASAHASLAYHDHNGNPTADGGPGDQTLTAQQANEGEVLLSDPAGITVRDPDAGLCRTISEFAVACAGTSAMLLGGDGDDTLIDQGVTGGFGARGGPGGDRITAGSVDAFLYGDDSVVLPSDGDDTIVGSSSDNIDPNQPGDFDDMINGGGGNDDINGGAGTDLASGQAGDDIVDGGDGNDELDTTSLLNESEEDAPGDAGNDTLRGSAGNDQLNANLGKDKADGGTGNDFVRAIDTFLYDDDEASDSIVCGDGADRVAGGAKDKLAVGCERLAVGAYCLPSYPCKASGTITGKRKGAKKPTTVAKASATLTSRDFVDFTLGSKATKLLGGASKITLTVDLRSKRGKTPAGSTYLRFTLTR